MIRREERGGEIPPRHSPRRRLGMSDFNVGFVIFPDITQLDSYLRDHRQDESNIVIEARRDQAAAKRSTTRWMEASAR